MAERLPTREIIPYENSSYLVDTVNGHAIVTYRFPKGDPQNETGYPLHILGTGFASPTIIDEKSGTDTCYFDPFMAYLAELHGTRSAMAAITWPGMTRRQVKEDTRKKTNYAIESQLHAMPEVLSHINKHIPSNINSVYVHAYSLGARVMLPSFSKQYGTDGSIMKQWIKGLNNNPKTSLILHMPAFELNADIMVDPDYTLVKDAAALLDRFPWINRTVVARMIAQAFSERTLQKLVDGGKIHHGNYYGRELSRKVLDPGTTALHLTNLIKPFDPKPHIEQALCDGFDVHLIQVKRDKLTNNNKAEACMELLGDNSNRYCHIISEEHTHTAHRNVAAIDELMQVMTNIIANHNS